MTVDQSFVKLLSTLTIREIEVAKLIAAGDSEREISKKLFISVGTVKSFKGKIYHKLQITSAVELIRHLIDAKLLVTPNHCVYGVFGCTVDHGDSRGW